MTEWNGVDLAGEPRFLLGRRKSSKTIEVRRVDVHQDLFDDLRRLLKAH